MTTAAPSIQSSVYGSRPIKFNGNVNYSRPNINGLVVKKLNTEYHNTFGDWLEKNGLKNNEILNALFSKKKISEVREEQHQKKTEYKEAIEQIKKEKQKEVEDEKRKQEAIDAQNEENRINEEIRKKQLLEISQKSNKSNILKWSLVGAGSIVVLVLIIKIIRK